MKKKPILKAEKPITVAFEWPADANLLALRDGGAVGTFASMEDVEKHCSALSLKWRWEPSENHFVFSEMKSTI